MRLQIVVKLTCWLGFFSLALRLSEAMTGQSELRPQTELSGELQHSSTSEQHREVRPGVTLRTKKRRVRKPMKANNTGRDARFLSLFTLVQFGNQDCPGGGTAGGGGGSGTCLTEEECTARGGTISGPCASAFGVCCLFSASCGQSTNQNCTYFVNPNYPSLFESGQSSHSCQLTLYKAHPDVCQYRIDFEEFTLVGPESTNNLCNTDQFIVSGGSPVPVICGVNTGNHIYVDAGSGSNSPITLTVVTGGGGAPVTGGGAPVTGGGGAPVTGGGGAPFPRKWKMRVCQIPCNSNYRAEAGCLQYFTGVAGQIKSFNYEPRTGLQLSSQDYSVCVRVERDFCGIQYTACPDPNNNRSRPFALSGNTQGGNIVSSMLGSLGPSSCPTDWLLIPCASNLGRSPTSQSLCVDRICGGTFSSELSTTSATVLSTVRPFRLTLHTDGTEAPADSGNIGFCLNYIQQPCTSSSSRLSS